MPADYDRSSHWLLSHHGDAVLRLAGLTGLKSWKCLKTDVVQPRRLPDGLLEVCLDGQEIPDLFLAEISTFPERRVDEQMVEDAMLVFLDRRVLPELLTIVLCPKGNYRIGGCQELVSRLRWSQLAWRWRVVEVWELSAEQMLATGDLGVVPWVPLMRIDGPPEPVLLRCRELIDQAARAEERVNLLAVTQVLMRLRFTAASLFELFGGDRSMIESPLLGEFASRFRHRDLLRILSARFNKVPEDIADRLRIIYDDSLLDSLVDWAVLCPDLDAFRARLPADRSDS